MRPLVSDLRAQHVGEALFQLVGADRLRHGRGLAAAEPRASTMAMTSSSASTRPANAISAAPVVTATSPTMKRISDMGRL